jgi:hypothetical protein
MNCGEHGISIVFTNLDNSAVTSLTSADVPSLTRPDLPLQQ